MEISHRYIVNPTTSDGQDPKIHPGCFMPKASRVSSWSEQIGKVVTSKGICKIPTPTWPKCSGCWRMFMESWRDARNAAKLWFAFNMSFPSFPSCPSCRLHGVQQALKQKYIKFWDNAGFRVQWGKQMNLWTPTPRFFSQENVPHVYTYIYMCIFTCL